MSFVFDPADWLADGEIRLKLTETKPADPQRGLVPSYHFAIGRPDGAVVGHCDLRVGHNQKLYYGGNIGYGVEEAHRGHHYAGKACLLLFQLARRHDMKYLYITCNPENIPSRRTCEYAGGVLEAIVDLPPDNDMYLEGERRKCVYRFEL